MCGRYVLKTSTPELASMFGIDIAAVPQQEFSSFNIAPTQPVLACRSRGEGRVLEWMRWGLIPGWSKDDRSSARMINARAETLAQRPAFRTAYRQRRCLLPASGFYEWKRVGRVRQPYYFYARSATPFAFAGLWERWRRPDGETIDSCAIVTTEANALVAPVHGRMPVILAPESYRAWLEVDRHPPESVRSLLAPLGAEALQGHPVSTLVNSPGNDDPRCIEPLGELAAPS